MSTAPRDTVVGRRGRGALPLPDGLSVHGPRDGTDPAVLPAPRGASRVLHDVPAAVLLVDVATGRVVHANPAAQALSAALPLPASSQEWVAAARIVEEGGAPHPVGESPLDRAARGAPVFGEPVQVPARREGVLQGGVLQEGALAERRTLWVTAFPLPQEGDALALVVLFDVETSLPEARIRDRAVVAAGLAFTISDPRRPDHPLIYVNPAFERTTGYSYAEVVGRNCRLLQTEDTDPAAVQRLRDAIRDEEHAVVTLLNRRKDGTAFWNELSLSPVYDGEGTLTHFVGIQADVTARVHVEQERARHLAAEQAARAAAELAQRRLALLAEATSMLAATLDVDEALERLTELAVPLMADWCLVELVGGDGEVRRVASSHVDPAMAPLLAQVQALQPGGRPPASVIDEVMRTGESVLMETVPDAVLDRLGDELAQAYRQLRPQSVVVVPLKARRQVLGALTLVTSTSGRRYDEDDLTMAADLARRAALSVDNARLYQREHQVAEALQRSLLPQLPVVPGVDRAARYLPGSTAAQVGGDWYDLFRLPDGAVGIAVGDVMGHDLTAAAAMGQLRSVLRSYAWQGGAPAVVLDHLDQLVQGLEMAQLATAIYARLDLPGDGPGTLRLANAGHLPPVLRHPDGRTELLDGTRSLLVGAELGTVRDELTVSVEAGSTLVLYTDGLVEQRGLDPDVGLERLRAAVAAVEGADAETVCEELLRALDGTGREDDVALLVVRLLPP